MKDKMPEKYTGEELEKEIDYTNQLLSTIENSGLSTLAGINEAFHSLQEFVDDSEEHITSSVDTDARVGHKTADTSFFGYKNHLAMSDERIITAAVVTPGNEGDGKYLQTLVEKSKEAGMDVEKILADAAYSGEENLNYAKENKITLVSKLNPSLTNDRHQVKFDYNKDSDQFICPAGHYSTRVARTGKKDQKGKNQRKTYYFDTDKCQICPFKDGCYKEGTKSKTYSVSIKKEIQTKQKEFQETKEFKEDASERYKIEAKNDELKNRHGLRVCKSDGLFGMTIQAATTIFVVNLKRITTLMDEKKKNEDKK
jgi:IS5 family transposase